MACFLAKTDLESHLIAELRIQKQTTGDGVTNPQAVNTIREKRKGDRVLFYDSG